MHEHQIISKSGQKLRQKLLASLGQVFSMTEVVLSLNDHILGQNADL